MGKQAGWAFPGARGHRAMGSVRRRRAQLPRGAGTWTASLVCAMSLRGVGPAWPREVPRRGHRGGLAHCVEAPRPSSRCHLGFDLAGPGLVRGVTRSTRPGKAADGSAAWVRGRADPVRVSHRSALIPLVGEISIRNSRNQKTALVGPSDRKIKSRGGCRVVSDIRSPFMK